MSVNIARFYKREKIELDCEIITPMFLGNASQEAELRAAPFKGLLRYWWRVANGSKYGDHTELLEAESAIFGSSDEKTGGKSQVTVEVSGELRSYPANGFPKGQKITHPEVKNKSGIPVNIDRFLYLGYGPITGAGILKNEGKGAFCPGQSFTLVLTSQQDTMNSLNDTIRCFQQFGSIGGRNRNGWGCFSVTGDQIPRTDFSALFQQLGSDWIKCFSRDYPHRLGRNGSQLLLWGSRQSHADWQGVMNELAEIYLQVRLEHHFQGGGPHASPQDRHALGYPSGKNHVVKNWGNQGRHGSALRLIVRKEADGHRGYILHLPHLFSKEMWRSDAGGKERQIQIWQQVHNSLDKLCQRQEIKGERS
jgi:CRISPR-associated protein Cmr1